jgi:hypothetical protein
LAGPATGRILSAGCVGAIPIEYFFECKITGFEIAAITFCQTTGIAGTK